MQREKNRGCSMDDRTTHRDLDKQGNSRVTTNKPLYSGVEIDYFHHTSNNDVPVEVIFWHERKDYQPIEIPSTLAPLGPTQRTISSPKHENFEGATPKWLTGLGGPGIVVAIPSAMLDSQVFHMAVSIPSACTLHNLAFVTIHLTQLINSRLNIQIDFRIHHAKDHTELYQPPSVPPSNLELNTCSTFRIAIENSSEYAVERYGEFLWWPVLINNVIVVKESTTLRYVHAYTHEAERELCLPYRTWHPEDLQGVLTTLGLRYSLISPSQLPQIDFGALV
ncbi:hypothetical protein EDD85DRAFT_932689 [Armillaria nabsnona]|nr:hypothetical protein EDD85DRAFT_932689 [Armillaria nabsnona]